MSGMYHDFGAIPNRKDSRQSEASESLERSRPSSRRLSRLSSTANTEEQTNSSAGTPQPESSKRVRQKRKEYSPEVEEKKKTIIVLTRKDPRKSGSTVSSTPKEQSPPQELGKREAKKKPRFSPSPQGPSKPVKEAEDTEEIFLLSTVSEVLRKLPEADYDLPKDIKAWAKRRANAAARKAAAEEAKKRESVNPSSPDEVAADGTFEEAQSQQERILFDEERPIHEHLFEQVPVKIEEPDDYETAAGPSRIREKEPEDIKSVIAAAEPQVPEPVTTTAPKKRKAAVSSGKTKAAKATPDKEPAPKRTKRSEKEPSPVEQPKPEEPGEGRRSRRSTAGFKELMAGLVSSSRPKATPKPKTETLKSAKNGKSEGKEETPVTEPSTETSTEPETSEEKAKTPKGKKTKKEKTQEPSPEPEPVAPIRRSGRSTVPSSKLAETGKNETPEFKVKPKPGSALEILKKTSRYQRVQRSPSPDTPAPSPAPSKASGSSSVPITPEKVVHKDEPALAEKPEETAPESTESDREREEKIKRRSERNRDLEERLDKVITNSFTEKANYSTDALEPKEKVPITSWSLVSSPTTFDSPRGTIKLVSKKKKSVSQAPEKTPEKQAPSPANIATRRSSRAFKPKVSDEDFVFEVPVVIRKEVEPSPPRKSPVKSPPPTKKEMRLRSSSVSAPLSEDESAAEKTRKYVEEHKGPIKLSFKIGSEVATVVKTGEKEIETGASTPTEEDELIEDVPTAEEEMVKVPSAPAPRKRKEPHWWNLYTPSPKPVLENFTRPDGTIEHLGVVVNSVMDALLLKVCDDGIRRHSNKMAKEARKAEMSEMAKKRYYEKKRIAEERQARGEPALPFPLKKTSAELFAHTISTRERTKKGVLYKNNEYLLKPVKLQREADMEREHREQEARDYLNRQFMREAEEDLRREARFKGRGTKPVKHVTFKEFTDARGGKTTQVLRPNTANPDLFHREILREPEDLTTVPDPDEISVDDEEEEVLQSLFSAAFIEQAQITSDQICNLFVRDPNVTNYTDMLGRLIEEPEIRQAIVANAIEVLIDFQQVKFGAECSPNAHVILHNEATTRAYDLRDSFSLGNAEKETMCWAHSFMIQNLPADYLPGYLILLRYWKHHSGSTVASFAKRPIQEEIYPWPEVTELIWSYILNKVVDPDRETLQATIDTEVLSDVIFVLVPPAFQYGDYSFSSKAHESIYRWLKMMGSKESYIMKMDYECRANETIYEAIAFYTTVLKNDILKLVREMRNKRIVLVGWGLTTYMCHRVVQLTHGISAIIDLAFPLRSIHGYRGGPDDDILLTYCPSLFVVGAQDSKFSAVALKELRTGMQTETGAVVVHYADANLYVPSYLLNRHNITQRAVSRSILEHIVDFLKLSCTKKERSQLIQADLNPVYTVEVDSLKAIVGGAPTAPQRVQKHATIDGGKPPSAPRQRKRKADFSLPPALLSTPKAMPSLLAEANATGTAAAEARYRFDEIVRSARIGGQASDVLSPTPRTAPVTFKSSPLPSPSIRPAPYHNPMFSLRAPPLPSPLIKTTQMEPPGKLLDPANISLS